MAKYFVVHTYTKTPQEFLDLFTREAPALAVSMVEGKTPARCLKSWNPIQYGRADYLFCLWEADDPEDIKKTLGQTAALDYITVDAMQVDEMDWKETAEAAMAAHAA